MTDWPLSGLLQWLICLWMQFPYSCCAHCRANVSLRGFEIANDDKILAEDYMTNCTSISSSKCARKMLLLSDLPHQWLGKHHVQSVMFSLVKFVLILLQIEKLCDLLQTSLVSMNLIKGYFTNYYSSPYMY